MHTVGHLALYIPTFIAGAVWRAYVFTYLWLWFVVAPFNVPVINTLQVIGLLMIVGVFRVKIGEKSEPWVWEEKWNNLIVGIMFIGMVFGISWVFAKIIGVV